MSRGPLLVDVAIAVVVASIVLIASPGVAVAALVGAVALVVCGLISLVERRRRRARINSILALRRLS